MCNFFGRERVAKMTGLLGFRHTMRRLIDFFSKVGAWAAWKSDHQQWGAGCLRDLEALPSQCLYSIFRQSEGKPDFPTYHPLFQNISEHVEIRSGVWAWIPWSLVYLWLLQSSSGQLAQTLTGWLRFRKLSIPWYSDPATPETVAIGYKYL